MIFCFKIHTQRLPTARLFWHCPFISLFYSDNQMIGGPNFCEFVLIRIDGENWESWKALNKAGMDCHVSILSEDQPTVYAALTGDQCAITNIRIKE